MPEAPLTCCVLQPTFLPWLGWFDIVDQVDLVVTLDDAAFSKQSWQQRNRIRTERGLEFVTVPVRTAGRLGQPIDEVHISSPAFVDTVMGRIQQNYRRAPYYPHLSARLHDVLRKASESGLLCQVNVAVNELLMDELGIVTPSVRASSLGVNGARGERVAAICEAVGAGQYLSPLGAADYLREDRESFDRRGIDVVLHAYEHPRYRQQHDPFEPYASVVDLLFNEGPGSLEIIRGGRRDPRPLNDSGR
jgi:hypothetical protein